ncbi:MAG: aminotransferase class I/II-fold pyridoxal phosphate-dependent enzyme [Planctomycetota bacterium]|jgi:aspartate/methionine/tyrosine aminotransferase
MALNPLAVAANDAIQADCPLVYDLLSAVGKRLFFPSKGILAQSAEAKSQATRYNATIGIATEGGEAMNMACVNRYYNELTPDELYPYAPSTGIPALREAWARKQRDETPSLGCHETSLPVVTNALTHGLELLGELFLDDGDEVLVPDMLWGNYRLTWGVRRGAEISTFPFFTEALDGFNQAAFEQALAARHGHKLTVVLNFPNNPSGYSPTVTEVDAIVAALTRAAEAGSKLVVVCDDAYYGMFYADDCASESIFGRLAQAHDNLLAIKIDGATKEMFVWALRIGFITYGIKNGTAAAYKALADKTGGAIRGAVSNINRPGQAVISKVLADPEFRTQQAEKVAVLRARAETTAEVVAKAEYADVWDVYPFNAGYFMCLRVKGVDADVLRQHLLSEHGIGTISLGATDLRVAFSCVEEGDIADLFDRVAQSIRALRA